MTDPNRRRVLDAVTDGRLPAGGPSHLAAVDLLDEMPSSHWTEWSEQIHRADQGRRRAPALLLCGGLRRARAVSALLALPGVRAVSATILGHLIADVERNPELAARLVEALQPFLPTEDAGPPRLIDADAAAARLGKSRVTIVRAARDGRVTGAQRVGRSWMFRAHELALAPPEGSKASRTPSRIRPQRHAGRDAANAIRGHQPTERTRP